MAVWRESAVRLRIGESRLGICLARQRLRCAFLYVHPLEWYLRVESPRDVIELPIDDELDVSGWEWRKALGLLKGANPTLIEWLDSPVVYQQDEETITALKAMVPKWFSPLRARWHYYSMAQKNFRGYLQADEVRLKKYFYVLRPLLAVRWVEAGKGVPPMCFAELLAGSELDAALRAEIDELLERKQRAGEAEYGPRRPLLHAFIRAELARGEIPPVLPDSREGDVRELDRLLMTTVMGNKYGPGHITRAVLFLLKQITMQFLHHLIGVCAWHQKHRLWLEAP